jgi:hypothetical protein
MESEPKLWILVLARLRRSAHRRGQGTLRSSPEGEYPLVSGFTGETVGNPPRLGGRFAECLTIAPWMLSRSGAHAP